MFLLLSAVPALMTAWGLAELFDWLDGKPSDDSDNSATPEPVTPVDVEETETVEPTVANAITGTDGDDLIQTDDPTANLYGGEGSDVFWVDGEDSDKVSSTYDVDADYAIFDENAEITIISDYDYASGDRILIEYNWVPDVEGTLAPDDLPTAGVGYSVSTSYGQLANGTMGTLIEGSNIDVEGGHFEATPAFVEGNHDHSFYVEAVAWLVRDTEDPIDEDALKNEILRSNGGILLASDFSTVTNKVIGTDDDDLIQSDDTTANLYGGDGADVFWVSETSANDFDITTDAAYDDPDSDPYGTYLKISEDADITVVRDFNYESGDRLLIDVNWYPDTEGTAAPTDVSGIYYNAVAAELPDGTTGTLFYSDDAYISDDGESLDGSFAMTPVFVAGYGNPYEFEVEGVVFLVRDTDAELDETALAAAVQASDSNAVSFDASDFALSV